MAIPPVVIQFLADGVPNVSRAMRSIGDIVTTLERTSTSATAAGVAARVRVVDQEAKQRAAIARRSEREFGAALRASARDAEQAARAETRAAMQAGNERIRIARSVAAEERRIRSELARNMGKPGSATTGAAARLAVLQGAKAGSPLAQKQALERVGDMRIADLGAKAQEKAAQRAARARVAAFQVADREEARARAQGVREFERAETQKNRAAMRWVRERERVMDQRRQRYTDAIMGSGSAAMQGLVRGGTALATTALQLGGGFSVQDALHEKLSLEREAALLSNTTNQGPGERVGRKTILDTVRATSVRTGTDEGEVMKGLNAYVAKTGKYDDAAKNIDFYAKVAKATGASLEDVTRTAGAMAVQNKDLTPEQARQLTLSTVMQARKGSVEFADMAQAGAKITRTATGYVGNQAQLQSELLGLSQIGMRSEGNNVSAAATDLANVQGDALKHRDKVRALLGHDFMNDKGQIQGGPSEFIAEMLRASGGNMAKLADAGIGKQALKTFQALSPTFNAAQEKALKEGKSQKEANAAGKAAVLADIKDVSAGKYDSADLEKDFAEVMSTSAEQFEGAVRQLKQEVGDKLVPALIPLVQILRDATPTIGRFLTALVSLVGWAERNPLAAAVAGMGGLLTKAVVAEVASARLGELIKSLLSGGGGGPGGGGLPGGKLGKGLAAVGAGLVAGELTKEWVDEGFNDEKKKGDARRARVIEANNLANAARRGALSPEQKQRMGQLQQQLAADSKAQADELDPANASLVKKVTGAFGAVVGGQDFADAQQTEQREQARALDQTTQALREVAAALKDNTTATRGNTGASGGGSGGSSTPGGTPNGVTGPITTRIKPGP